MPVQILPSLEHLPGSLPTSAVDKEVDTEIAIAEVTSRLASIQPSDFTADGFWRDQYALTGTLRTFYSPDKILPPWSQLIAQLRATNFRAVPQTSRNAGNWVEGRFEFEVAGPPSTTCSGILYLVQQQGGWKIWLLCTILEDIVGQESVDLRKGSDGRPVLALSRPQVDGFESYDLVIIGAGQSGLATAGWAKSLGLKYLVVERNAKIGDNWLNRYDSAKLHTTQRFNDLPFGPTFSAADPQFLTIRSLADGYNRYVKQFDINVWLSASLYKPATYDSKQQVWQLEISHKGTNKILLARHLVLATGPGGTIPLVPNFADRQVFKGQWMHSVDYKNSRGWKGQNVVVVGTANTGHDVAEDAFNAGAQVTMVQRTATYVVQRELFIKLFDLVWNDFLTQEVSDRFFWCPPLGVSRHMVSSYLNSFVDQDFAFFDALEKTGFRCIRKADFMDHLLIRFGGHFMNTGVSEMISEGKIAIKNDSLITSYTSKGLKFADGSELDADVIIMATGFEKDIVQNATPILGKEVVDKLVPYWGVDADGEVSGAFVPSGVPHLWLTGGGCCHARYFTRFVTLQVLAECLGTPLAVYTE